MTTSDHTFLKFAFIVFFVSAGFLIAPPVGLLVVGCILYGFTGIKEVK